MKFNFKNEKLKKYSTIIASVIVGLYLVFLLLPFVLSPIANSYSQHVADLIKSTTGLDAQVDGLGVVTSPKLSAGLKVKNISISIPAAEYPLFKAKDLKIKLALLPILIRKVQLDEISAKSVNGNFIVKKDGSFLVMDYLTQDDDVKTEPLTSLPFGFKLSNHLPNLKANDYNVSFVDALDNKSYSIKGEKLKVSDFILDKKIKLSTKGQVILDKSVVSNYDLNIFNKIMPNLQLDDLVFPKQVVLVDEKKKDTKNSQIFNVIDLFKAIHKNEFTADLTTNVKTFGTLKSPHFKGSISLNALSVDVNGKKLPESYMNLVFKGNKIDVDSILFTSLDENEKTQVIGDIHTGKNPSIDMTLRSNAKFNNIIRLVDSIAQSFECNDFKTMSATGGIDADFNINSDLKKVSSTGYLKINPSKFIYGLYNVVVDNITADVDLMNNDIVIKKAGFSIFGHPLKLSGSISSDSYTDLKLVADKLSVKGLIAAFGQIALLKDNSFDSGTLSVNATVKGKLKQLNPIVNANLNNLNVLNKPSNTRVTLKDSLIEILCDNKALTGNIDLDSLKVKLPTASISVPKTKIVMDSNDINIKNSYLLLNNSKIDISGIVEDYLTDKLNISILAKGDVLASDIMAFIPTDMRSMFPYAGKLPLQISVSGNEKTQDVSIDLTANKSNYVTLADIDFLKNKKTKMHTDVKITNDDLTFLNSGIWANDDKVANLSGGISKLYSEPDLNISISVPQTMSFPIWGMKNSNISAYGNISVLGNMTNPIIKGSVNASDISIKDMDFSISDLVANFDGPILNGKATARSFKFGGIIADNISSDFSLVDYDDFCLNNIVATAFSGKINGNISYSIQDAITGVDLTGETLNSTDAINGAVGIKNALTGLLDFNAKLSMQGVTDKDIIKSMKGNVSFNINDGRFMGIGRLENLVAAQNVSSNSILKAAISSLSYLSTIQETNKFKSISGDMIFSNGVANISNIKVAGPLMSYFVSGTYNILPNSANLVILGRLEAKVVSCLGVLGDLSAEKLLSNIPKLGALTSSIFKQLTSDPASENIALIPALTGGSNTYKDFKVIFNGPVESTSSVRSFKWLSTCDTTQIDTKKELQNAADAIKSNVTNRIEETKTNVQNVKTNVNNIVETQKNKVQTTKQNIEQTKTDIQNIKNNFNSEGLKNILQKAVEKSQTQVPSSNTTTGQ